MSKVETYINSAKRIAIVESIEQNAKLYKNAFAAVEEICDKNINIPGCMNQVITAINDTTGRDFMSEVVYAKQCYANLQNSICELISDGVPGIVGLEYSRRILEENVTGAREFTVEI